MPTHLRERLARNEAVYGTMVTIFDNPEIARVLREAGLDWFFYDGEHVYPNYERVTAMFAYGQMAGMPSLIRIPEISKTEVFRALDAGAAGIVCPNVETVEMARELVELAKYAPLGNRGVSMTRPHTAYKKLDAASYMEKANAGTILICQMESVRGVENLDAILRVDGVDGVLVGPNDLTQSMGIINQLEHPQYIALVEKVIALCQKHGKIPGISGKDLAVLRRWKEKGMRLLQWGTDVSLLMTAIRGGLGS